MKSLLKIAVSCALLITASAAAAESQRHMTIIGPSKHPTGSTLHDETIGLAYGRTWSNGGRNECMLEGGVFHNSYLETGPYAVAGCLRTVAETPVADLLLGASLGAAYYPTLSKKLQADFGLPATGGMIPLPMLNGAIRIGQYDFRTATTFGGKTGKIISNVSLAIHF